MARVRYFQRWFERFNRPPIANTVGLISLTMGGIGLALSVLTFFVRENIALNIIVSLVLLLLFAWTGLTLGILQHTADVTEKRHRLQSNVKHLRKQVANMRKSAKLQGASRSSISESFTAINVARAHYSGVLHTIQDLILNASNEEAANRYFGHSARRHRDTLNIICDHASDIFEAAHAGRRFNVNIKFLVEPNPSPANAYRGALGYVTGIDRKHAPPLESIGFRTAARSLKSRDEGRGKQRNESEMTVQNHLLLRSLVASCADYLYVDDLARFIADASAAVTNGTASPFEYPDSITARDFYSCAVIVPIISYIGDTLIDVNANVPVREDKVYGFLAIDTRDARAFNLSDDLMTCKEIAAIIMSTHREYGRCISHLEKRARRETTGYGI